MTKREKKYIDKKKVGKWMKRVERELRAEIKESFINTILWGNYPK